MKKVVFFFLILAVTAISSYGSGASAYKADDNLIDQLFSKAPETINPVFANLSVAGSLSSDTKASSKDPVVAIILDFFLGELGVHRFYLGTKVMTGVGYIITCGGIFGIVPLIDFIELIINYNDISKYVNNPKFFMWT